MRYTIFLVILSYCLIGCHFHASIHEDREALRRSGAKVRPSRMVYHQGCALRYPGNSLPAIECAIRERAPIIEIDIRASNDGELFLFHDRRINLKAYSERMCSMSECPSVALSDLSSEEIASWRYRGNEVDSPALLRGSRDRECGKNIARCTNETGYALRILRFDDLVELDLDGSDLLLDIKGDDLQIAKKILAKTKATHLEKRLIFSCSRGSNCIEELKQVSPASRVLFRAKSPIDVIRALTTKPEIIQIDKEWSSPELEDKIREAGASILLKVLSIDYLLVDR